MHRASAPMRPAVTLRRQQRARTQMTLVSPTEMSNDRSSRSSPVKRRRLGTPALNRIGQPESTGRRLPAASPRCQSDGDFDNVSSGKGDSQDAEERPLEEVIMSLELRDKTTIGCAYFDTANGLLSLSDNITMSDNHIIDQLITHVQPTSLLVSARAPYSLLEYLETRSEPAPGDETTPFILRAVASSDFSNTAARDQLSKLQLCRGTASLGTIAAVREPCLEAVTDRSHEGLVDTGATQTNSSRCRTFVDLDVHIAVNCAGAILADLQRRRSQRFLPDGRCTETMFDVAELRMFCPSDYMFVGAETLSSLQIVQSELHPNAQAWGACPKGTYGKESLSIYGLFQQLACTAQGRHSLKQMFLRPTLSLAVISERQRAIAFLLSPENSDLVSAASSFLRKMKNVSNVLERLRKGVDSPIAGQSFERSVWAALRTFAAQVLGLKELLSKVRRESEVEIIRQLQADIQAADMVAVGEMVNRTIDFDQSKSRNRPSVKMNVDLQLDELKRRYDGMGSFLTQVVNHVNKTLPEWASQYIRSCIFLPQLGFLMEVELDPQTGTGKYEGEGASNDRWERLFVADGAVCYKNSYMRELDRHYGDMYCEIGDREVEIIHGLAREVLGYAQPLLDAYHICSEFDAILALAKGAEKYNLVAPCMSTTSVLHIQGGRHLLQELVVSSFIPNDCHFTDYPGEDDRPFNEPDDATETRVLVVTGPNNSGKSVYLKQVAIIVYLAHIGSFVPAESATVGLTDKILTRISTRESVSCKESAFSIELKEMARAVTLSTSRSLILVDEFGKGTNADDGAGLLAAALDYFLHPLGGGTPRMIMATHFHELIRYGYLDGYPGLQLAHMNVTANQEIHDADNHLTYLFKLMEGYSSSSFASKCAALNGVPQAVVSRAEAIAQLLDHSEDLSIACTRLPREEEYRLEEAEMVARCFLEEASTLNQSNIGGGSRKSAKAVLEALLSLKSF